MEILRVPPYNLQKIISVENSSTEYIVKVEDSVGNLISSNTLTSDENSKIYIQLPYRYDETYRVYSDEFEEFATVVRPYVDPTSKGSTASEIRDYSSKEELARAVIDSVITDGFYLKTKTIETVGLGTDYIPLWIDAKKVLKVYENNVLVFDSQNLEESRTIYTLSDDKTAVIEKTSGKFNRKESASISIPSAPSDYVDLGQFSYRGFPKGNDYKIVLEVGHYTVPQDIVRATELLIYDIECGKLEYFKRYVTAYNTDQFKIQFDGKSFEGTGNLIVDKILSKYAKSIKTIGVL
jgi:hypothetical protein